MQNSTLIIRSRKNAYATFVMIRSTIRASAIFILFLLFSADQLFAQSSVVSGTVTSKTDKSSIPGISVTIKGTQQGVITDASGKYSINAKKGTIIIFSGVGYQTLEVKVAGPVLDVELDAKQNSLNEVVVIGYGTSTRANVTTAVSKIDPKVVPQGANSSVAELVFGRAAGLTAQQSSTQPGGNINLSIRGQGAPLIVVDGVIFPNDGLEPGIGIRNTTDGVNRGSLQGINPGDIESIEVLKDASASIYGVNASNGVILITTKKGKNGKPNVSLDIDHSFLSNTSYLTPLTASQYETQYNLYSTDQYLGAHGMAPYGAAMPSGVPAPKYSADQIAAAGVGTKWLDQIFRNGFIDNDNLSISGGTDKVTYYFSGGFFNQSGTLKGADLTKYNGRANLSFKLAKWVTLNANTTGSSNWYHNSTSGGQSNGAGSQGFGVVQAALAYPSNLPVYSSPGVYSLWQTTSNPVSLLDVQDHTRYHALNPNFSADFTILPNELTAKVMYGDNYETSIRDFFVPSTIEYYQGYLQLASQNYLDREYQTMSAQVDFKKELFKQFHMDLLGVVEQDINSGNSFYASGSGAQDGLGDTDLAAEVGNITISSSKYVNTTRSYISRASFDYLNRYLLSASIRDDGYSLFFPQKKFASFPSVSAGWKISEEPFFKGLTNTVDLLKLRGSIGTTGATIGSAAYGGFAPYNDNIYFSNAELVTIRQYAVDNPNLTWQKTVDRDFGLDFGLFNDRLSGSVDYFKNDITNLLSTGAPTAPLAPLFTQSINGAHQVRTGWEVALNSHNIVSKDFDWSTIINVSHYNLYYKTLFPFTVLQPYQNVTDPVGEIYYVKTNGLLQVGQAVPNSQPTSGGASLPGSPIFVDKNGDGKIDVNDVYKLNPNPKVIIGFGNTFRFRQFDLTAFFYGQIGSRGYNLNYAWSNPVGIATNASAGVLQNANYYSSANPKGTLPSVNYVESSVGLPAGTDIGLVNTSFVRLRNLTLGYTLNNKSINSFAKSIRIFVDAQNVFVISGYKGVDPEVTSYSIKGGYAPYPITRSISVGAKASF
ncbi:MAG TPA: SusC/RagA family TonB-linked outer membrane protein [Mucilaginibacter sp.]|jgi:TonB-linked SusC/RagA family outer membrane protein